MVEVVVPEQQPLAERPLLRKSGWNAPAIAFLTVLSLTMIAIEILVVPSRFYDYATYLLYLDSIYHFPQPDWYVFEGVTKAYLLFLREIFGTTEGAVVAAHYLLLALFLPGFFLLFRRAPWETTVVAAALFAPQLGLVTIRATPAYIVCAFAALRAIDDRPWALRLALIATTLHVSAFLAVIPIVITKVLARTPLARFNLKLPLVLALAAGIGVFVLFLAQDVFDLIIQLFKQTPYLAKYSAYAVGLADPNAAVDQTITEPISANHYVFLVGVSILFLAVVWFETKRTLLKLFAAVSYVLYLSIFLGFSPVPAFRYAPYFALPVLASARLNREGLQTLRGALALPFLAICLAVFAIQVSLVLD